MLSWPFLLFVVLLLAFTTTVFLAPFSVTLNKQSNKSRALYLQSLVDEALVLRQRVKQFLSTNSAHTPPSPGPLSQESLDRILVRYDTFAEAVASQTAISPFTQTSSYIDNIQGQQTANTQLTHFVNEAIAKAEAMKVSSPLQASLIEDYIVQLKATLLGSCDTGGCGGCCFFGTCGAFDCGVCDCCGCNDTLCCPPAPPGWPGDCGDAGVLGCSAAIPYIQTNLTQPGLVCGAASPSIAMSAMCTAASQLADGLSPGVIATCNAASANLSSLCASTPTQVANFLAQVYGCTCPEIIPP